MKRLAWTLWKELMKVKSTEMRTHLSSIEFLFKMGQEDHLKNPQQQRQHHTKELDI